MRRLSALLVSLALVGGVGGVLADTASASVSEASIKKFCQKALTIGNNIPSGGDSLDDARDASKAIAKNFKALQKVAPKKIRKAIKTIVKWYNAVADADENDLQDVADDYAKAIGKYSRFVSDKCSPTDISLPQ